jgi:elongation factor P
MVVSIRNGIASSVDMPPSVILEVTYAEQPGIRGIQLQTQPISNCWNGATVNVLFINEGDKIKIDTASGSYMERVKE